jgi:hypothetical protein
MTESLPLPVPAAPPVFPASLAALAAIPEEEVWLASQKSARARRAYRQTSPTSCGRSASPPRRSCARWTTGR